MRTTHINDGWLDTDSTEAREILDFRGEGFGPLLSLGRFHYHSATEPLPNQQHADWLVLVFAIDGAQHYRLGDSQVLLSAGQVMRVPPGTRYGSGPWPEQRGTVAWMILNVRAVLESRELGINEAVAEEMFRRLIDVDGPLVFSQPCLATGLLTGMFSDWLQRDSPLQRDRLRHHLATVLLGTAIALGGDDEAPVCPALAGTRIHEVRDWLARNLRKEIRIEDLAARARLSQARFFREFKAVTGVTPNDYVLRLKIEEAAAMLERDPSLTVTQVAHNLSFSSSQYFATVFRRYLGISPGDFRKQLGRVTDL
jgi:AraC-like DNA-binding protein